MRLKEELQYFVYIVCATAIWMYIATWLMPRVLNAPTFAENPTWYYSSMVLGMVLSYVLRIGARVLGRKKIRD